MVFWLINAPSPRINENVDKHCQSVDKIRHRGIKRKFSECQSSEEPAKKKVTFVQRVRRVAMTILTSFLPDSGQWSPYFGWGYSPDGANWWNSQTTSSAGFQKHFHGEGYSQADEFSSDSDSDIEDFCFNMNNSSRVRRRSRRQTPSSLKKLISPSDFLIEFASDNNSKSSSSKNSSKGSSKEVPFTKPAEATETDQLRRSKRNGGKENVVWFCDSDTEDDINETSSYSVYKYLKTLLISNGRQIDSIKGDGNCFFRALSKVIYGSQSFYRDVRKAVVDLMEKFPKRFEAFTDGPVSMHISDMKLDKTWATQVEIYAAATLLKRDIYILSPDQSGEKYRWLLFSPQFKYNSDLPHCTCYITLCHTHGNHYDRVTVVGDDCNCDLDPPELSGITETLDLTDEYEIV